MQFSDWVTAVGAIFSVPIINASIAAPSSNADFNNIYPRAIEYAEQRIFRELDLLNTIVTDETGMLSANSRKFTLPASGGIFFVTKELYVLVGGVRQPPLLPVSREFLESVWAADTAPNTPSIPSMWCPVDQVSVLVAPPPDLAYSAGVVGTKRQAALSASNTPTFISTNLPDAFLAATNIFLCGYQRDFGPQGEQPQSAISWEATYRTAMASADVEEMRKKFLGPGASTNKPPHQPPMPPQGAAPQVM